MIINFDEMTLSQRAFYYRMFARMSNIVDDEIKRHASLITQYRNRLAETTDDSSKDYWNQCIEDECDEKEVAQFVLADLEVVAENKSISFSGLDFKGISIYFSTLADAWETIVTKREYYEQETKKAYERLRDLDLTEHGKETINDDIIRYKSNLEVIEYIEKVMSNNIK